LRGERSGRHGEARGADAEQTNAMGCQRLQQERIRARSRGTSHPEGGTGAGGGSQIDLRMQDGRHVRMDSFPESPEVGYTDGSRIEGVTGAASAARGSYSMRRGSATRPGFATKQLEGRTQWVFSRIGRNGAQKLRTRPEDNV